MGSLLLLAVKKLLEIVGEVATKVRRADPDIFGCTVPAWHTCMASAQ
jgi:hypothetical protein